MLLSSMTVEEVKLANMRRGPRLQARVFMPIFILELDESVRCDYGDS